MIVCPGGGYGALSDREAEPIAAQFLAAGFATFILRYSVGEGAKDFAPLKQVALAVKYVRENAEKYNVDPAYVFTCGFSAGGHLAASAGVLWDHPEAKAVLGDAPEGINRPTGMILCYPVISSDERVYHQGSYMNLLGEDLFEKRKQFDPELLATEKTPPAFIWHTAEDGLVPVANSCRYTARLAQRGVYSELHVFPYGAHGRALALAIEEQHTAQWKGLLLRWFMLMGWYPCGLGI